MEFIAKFARFELETGPIIDTRLSKPITDTQDSILFCQSNLRNTVFYNTRIKFFFRLKNNPF